jgi:hypothetical protein
MSQLSQIVNSCMSAGKLLSNFGLEVTDTQSVRCPFHEDSRSSAKYYKEDNSLFCFAESKTYRPYDMLQMMGVTEQEMVSFIVQAGVEPPSNLQIGDRRHLSIFKEDSQHKAMELKNLYITGRISAKDLSQGLEEIFVEG